MGNPCLFGGLWEAVGRKFFATKYEDIDGADSYLSVEDGYPNYPILPFKEIEIDMDEMASIKMYEV